MSVFDDIELNDDIFDIEAVESGSWSPGPYGPHDCRGTFNEVTPAITARALLRLDVSRPVSTYNLSETLFNGFPAYGSREYTQVLALAGYEPKGGFDSFQGIIIQREPFGPNRMSVNDERVQLSYNMGTKINGLSHCGVGNMFYNGNLGSQIARSWGLTSLDNPTMGPIVTRGLVVDVAGFKENTDESVIFRTSTGQAVLSNGYRITIEDIQDALAWANVTDPIAPGDVVLIRTGWRHLIKDDPERYLNDNPPGVYLRECRYLAQFKPALVGSDTWCFETLDPNVNGGNITAGHQELFMRFGIRIAESIPTCALVNDGVYDFVFCFNPQWAKGAVSASAPPLALGQPK